MSATTTTTENPIKQHPTWGAGAAKSSPGFWKSYIAARPDPPKDFFDLIHEYHISHGDPQSHVAHDVGTGPGNIAEKLLRHFDHVVGSDVNEKALAEAPSLIPVEIMKRMTLIHSPAEQLASATISAQARKGETDLVLAAECIPLLDAPKALETFNALLRPGATLAIYFYGRPIFTGDGADELNDLYERAATRLCQLQWPIKGTPDEPFQFSAIETLHSYLDNVAFPQDTWDNVTRYKWNSDVPLVFSSLNGYDFDVERVDCRASAEVTKEITDRDFWAEDWDIDRVTAFILSLYVGIREKAGDKYSDVESLLAELESALGGPGVSRKVSFPVVLLLATKKE